MILQGYSFPKGLETWKKNLSASFKKIGRGGGGDSQKLKKGKAPSKKNLNSMI